MSLKKNFTALVIVTAVIITAYAIFNYKYSKPGFVANAEKSTNNFLQYTYGKGECIARASNLLSWDMICSYQHNSKVITYIVQPLVNALPDERNKFHLIATNELAKRSATNGLTKYLNNDTNKM